MDAKRFLASSIACASLAVATTAVAEDTIPDRYFYLGGHIGQSWLDIGDHYEGDGYLADNAFENDTVTLPGAQIGYRFSENWSVQAWYERNNMSTSDGEVYLRNNFASLRRHFNGDGPIESYVGLGAGETRTEFNTESDDDFKETIGGMEFGVQTALADNFLIDVGARPTYSFRTERWDGQVYAALNVLVGAQYDEEPKPEPVTETATDSDNDGVPDSNDRCPGTPAGASVDAQGCELDDDGDGVVNSKDECPDTPARAKVDDKGCQEYLTKDVRETLYVEFGLDKAEVRETSYPELESLSDQMYQYPSADLVLEGHTDSTGSAAYNQQLSEKRADAVKRVMVEEFGIDESRITTEGYGEAKPIADNSTRDGRAQNRRVEAIMKATTEEAQYDND